MEILNIVAESIGVMKSVRGIYEEDLNRKKQITFMSFFSNFQNSPSCDCLNKMSPHQKKNYRKSVLYFPAT